MSYDVYIQAQPAYSHMEMSILRAKFLLSWAMVAWNCSYVRYQFPRVALLTSPRNMRLVLTHLVTFSVFATLFYALFALTVWL